MNPQRNSLSVPSAGWQLMLRPEGWLLCEEGGQAVSLRQDFGAPSLQRRTQGGGLLRRAIGAGAGRPLEVLDATAGFGTDAYVLAAAGCQVTMCERHPIVATLLLDALHSAHTAGGKLATVAMRMSLRVCDACSVLPDTQFDVVYLDPMFPPRRKVALAKKLARSLWMLAGAGDVAQGGVLLALAQRSARQRVVVKRPPRAPPLPGTSPAHSLAGKLVRFDVYPRR